MTILQIAGSRYLDAQFQPYQQAKMIASITAIDIIADMIDIHIFMNFNIIRSLILSQARLSRSYTAYACPRHLDTWLSRSRRSSHPRALIR